VDEESSLRARRAPVAGLVVYDVSCRPTPIEAEVEPLGRLAYCTTDTPMGSKPSPKADETDAASGSSAIVVTGTWLKTSRADCGGVNITEEISATTDVLTRALAVTIV